MIRVVHLLSTLHVGGLEKFVLDLARLTDHRCFDVRVLCLLEKGPLEKDFVAAHVPVDSLDCQNASKLPTLVRLVDSLRRLRPHVLHTHNPNPHVFGTPASRLAGIPVLIHTKHGRNYPKLRRSVLINRLASHFSDAIVAVSADAADVARRVEGVPPEKVHVIRNGIDLARFDGTRQFSPAKDSRKLRFIHVARLDPVKDQATLLRAARMVADSVPDFQLDIVGDGPEGAKLREEASRLALDRQVRFLGCRSDVPDLLASAGAFVLSSISEGISLTLLEAMAAGLPVVATDVGGNREVVETDWTGILVPPRSPRDLAVAIRTLIDDPGMARRMGQAGRRRVEQFFDIRRVVRQYEELYLRLLARKRCIAPWIARTSHVRQDAEPAAPALV
jgi:sugar transferase (PEP-CTERM/EpsH1 system associated)